MKKGTRTNVFTRITASILTMLLVFYAIPSIVYAEIIDAISELSNIDESTVDNSLSENIDKNQLNPIYEVEELREESVKHFRLENGNFVIAQYEYPVHVVGENDEWQDINNVLLSQNGGIYANENSRIKFSKKITGNERLFVLKDGNNSFSMSLIGANKGVEGIVTNFEDSAEDTELQKMMNLEKLSSRILYADILDGVDIEYITQSLNVKENIIVKECRENYSYSFELKLNGMEAELLENGSISFIDKKNGETKYIIPEPLVYDGGGEITNDNEIVYYTLDGKNGKYVLTVTVDSEWMNAEERTFPVVIDPTVITGGTRYVEDTFISSRVNQTNNNGAFPYLSINNYSTAYWKLTQLPQIPDDSYLDEVTLSLKYGSSQGRFLPALRAFEVTSYWSEESFIYPDYNRGVGAVSTASSSVSDLDGGFVYHWDITALANKWYEDPSTNFGVALRPAANPFGLDVTTRIESRECQEIDPKISMNTPVMNFVYCSTAGYEDYFSYSSHNIGNGGVASVNNATGNMVITIPTISTTDFLMPFTPTLVYNSFNTSGTFRFPITNFNYPNEFMPYGVKLNLFELIASWSYVTYSGDTKLCYLYEDADGTTHMFAQEEDSENVFKDVDALQKTITVLDDENIKMTDLSKTEKIFINISSNCWALSKITDANNNSLIFTYDADFRPVGVSLQPNGLEQIDFIEFLYNSSGNICAVYNPTTKDAVVLGYSDEYNGEISYTAKKYLRKVEKLRGLSETTKQNVIDYCAGTANSNICVASTNTYEYSEQGKITGIVDEVKNQEVRYTWTNSKVTEIAQYADEVLGQKISFTYGVGYTDVRNTGNDEILNTDDDIITRYIFDEKARAVSIYTCSVDGTKIYGATVGKYEEQENVKNNLKEQLVVGGVAVNYLLNGNFKQYNSATSVENWTLSGNVVRASNGVIRFNPTVNSTSSINQYVYLEQGEYTLSMPVTSYKCQGVSARVKITSIGGGNFSYTDEILLSRETSRAQDFATTFSVNDAANGGDKLKISIEVTAGNALEAEDAQIDISSVMLERNVGASSFSLLNMGSFDDSAINADGTDGKGVSDFWSTESGGSIVFADGITGSGVKIEGNKNAEKYIKQRIYEASTGLDDSSLSSQNHPSFKYIISGFAYAGELTAYKSAVFEIRVDIKYSTDDVVSHSFKFEPYCEGWQYVAGSIDTEVNPDGTVIEGQSIVEYIDIYCVFSNQPTGYAIFDNISVVDCKSTDKESFEYYENGLLAKKSNLLYEEYYEYDDSEKLIRVANNYGELTDYVYDTEGKNIIYQVSGEYVSNSTGNADYPYEYEDPDTYITITPKTRTDYTYNSYGLKTYESTYEVSDYDTPKEGTKYITNTSVYNTEPGSKIFGALLHQYDSFEEGSHYYYDQNNGKLMATINSEDHNGVCYVYDDEGKLVNVRPASYTSETVYSPVTNSSSVTYGYDDHNFLSSITTETTVYNFTYDVFGNKESVKIGNSSLAGYVYNPNNGKLARIDYGNGFSVEYVYNELENISEIWYNYSDNTREQAYKYEYTGYGSIYKVVNLIENKETVYTYDTSQRLIGYWESNANQNYGDFSSTITYNDKALVSGVGYKFTYSNSDENYSEELSYHYNYNSNDMISSVSSYYNVGQFTQTFAYDDFNRVTGYSLYHTVDSITKFNNEIQYVYRNVGNNTTIFLEKYTSKINGTKSEEYEYTYDDTGNITKISYWLGAEIRYVYDEMNRLVREDNTLLNQTVMYEYDKSGNILKKKVYELTAENASPTDEPEEFIYSYSNSAWGDLLTEYDGEDLTYDAIGNPLSYYNGFTYTWQGRRMASAATEDNVYSFTYNDNGIRTSKTENGKKTLYYLNGSQIIGERTGDEIYLYIYDANGFVIGFQYRDGDYDDDDWDVFWYEKNMHGDIVAIYDEDGDWLVSYTYDAWGNFETEYSSSASNSPAKDNPFLYRGYYYDRDLGLYYLNSRYYDANTGRFINCDSYETLVATPIALSDKNLFAYCDNNPVSRVDGNGDWWLAALFVSVVVRAAINMVSTAIKETVDYVKTGDPISDTEILDAGIKGAVEGAVDVIAPGASVLVDVAESVVDGVKEGDSVKEIVIDATATAFAGTCADGLGKNVSENLTDALEETISATKRVLSPTSKVVLKETKRKPVYSFSLLVGIDILKNRIVDFFE